MFHSFIIIILNVDLFYYVKVLYLCIHLFLIFEEFSTIISLNITYIPFSLLSSSRISPRQMLLFINLFSLSFKFLLNFMFWPILVQFSEFINVLCLMSSILYFNDYIFHFKILKDFIITIPFYGVLDVFVLCSIAFKLNLRLHFFLFSVKWT